MGRIIPAFAQFFGDDALPLANGWLRFLVSGSNNTDKNTYFDPTYQIANPNPLQLDAEGRCPNVFGLGDYRVISFVNDPEDEDSPGEQIQMFDPVTAQGTLESTGASGFVFNAWDNAVNYDLGDIVSRDLAYYRSLINSNFGLDPLIETFAWERIDFLPWYNETIFYSIGDVVYYIDNLWISLTDANQNHTPTSSPTNWRQVATGYKSYSNQTGNYAIVSSDRDRIIVLTPAALADAEFILPAMDTTTQRFRIAIYNASSYDLTIRTSGAAGIWLNSGGTFVITQGCLIELIYNSLLDSWLPLCNVGPAMGAQDIGTVTFPVLNLYATDIFATNLTLVTALSVPTTNLDTLNVSSNGNIFLGDASEVSLSYLSGSTTFNVNVATGTTFNYRINSVDAWIIAATGELLPALTNPTPEIGSATNSLGFLFANNVSLPTGGYLYLGNSDQFLVSYDGLGAVLEVQGTMAITTSTLSAITLSVNSTSALQIATDYNTYLGFDLHLIGSTPTLHFGNPNLMTLSHTGAVGILNTITGNMYLQSNSSEVCRYNSTSAFISVNATFADNTYCNFGNSSDFKLVYLSATNQAFILAEATVPIFIVSGGGTRWQFNASGNFIPFATETYDIGTPLILVRNLYTGGIYGDGNPMRFGLAFTGGVEITSIGEENFSPGLWRMYITVQTVTGTSRTYTFYSNSVP